MIRNFIFSIMSFMILALLGLGAQDYLTQSMVAGKSPAEFGVKNWMDSFATRGEKAAARAKRELQRDGDMRDYLPAAPSGWERVDWHPEYEKFVKGKSAEPPLEHHALMAEIEADPTFKAMKTLDALAGAGRDRKRAMERYVYKQGDKVVILQARYHDPQLDAPSGIAAMLQGTPRDFEDLPVKFVHRGIGFRDASSFETPTDAQRLKARIGQDVEILVRGINAEADLPRILSRLDVAALRELATPKEQGAEPSHHALMAEMRRNERAAMQRAAIEREEIDRLLERRVQTAGRNAQEVCIDYKGKQHCRWAN